MIVLDTHMVSQPLRHTPDRGVIAWIDAQPLDTLFLSAITVTELRTGVALLPTGKRRSALQDNHEQRVLPLFAGRVLPFDPGSTGACAERIALARSAGFAIATADACIAAIAVTNGHSVATRDTRPFKAAGVAVINPWPS